VTVADLHVHTTVTDGRLKPTEVVELAAEIGLEYLVFTDHSAVTFESVLDHAAARGVRLPFPGTEISTFLGNRKHHVLIYGHGLLSAEVQQWLLFPVEGKLRDAQRALDALSQRGFRLPPLADITAAGTTPGRPTPEKLFPSRTAIAWQLAQASRLPLAEARRQVESAFHDTARGGTAGPPHLEDRYLPTLKVIGMAAARGLTTSLAHPLWECATTRDISEVCDAVRLMADTGLAGMESRSYHHREFDDHPMLLRTRADLGLIPTGGSDFHANGKTELGSCGLLPDEFSAFWEVVANVNHT
jgi:predicted metal-dependent phosphoesterase TrpH